MKLLKALGRLVPPPLDTLLAIGVVTFCVGVAMIYLPAGLIALGSLVIAASLRLGGSK